MMNKLMKQYLRMHAKLVAFMAPIAKEHCSPCKHNRGEYGCCTFGPHMNGFEFKLNGLDENEGNKATYPCRFLVQGKGCSMKHKSGICLVYLCAPILNSIPKKQNEEYWRLREQLSEAQFNLDREMTRREILETENVHGSIMDDVAEESLSKR